MVRSLPFLTDSMNMGFFRNGNNLLFAGVSAVFGITDSGTVAEDVLSPGWQPLLYTFLLGLLYFLFREKADEELLVALGLLLIL